jgi:hypothetical protein
LHQTSVHKTGVEQIRLTGMPTMTECHRRVRLLTGACVQERVEVVLDIESIYAAVDDHLLKAHKPMIGIYIENQLYKLTHYLYACRQGHEF